LIDLGIAEGTVSEWTLQNLGDRKWADFLRIRVRSKEINLISEESW
jgi:hypothetical protein